MSFTFLYYRLRVDDIRELAAGAGSAGALVQEGPAGGGQAQERRIYQV